MFLIFLTLSLRIPFPSAKSNSDFNSNISFDIQWLPFLGGFALLSLVLRVIDISYGGDGSGDLSE